MKQYKLISVCSFILLSFFCATAQNQGVPEGSATIVIDRQSVEKLSIEDFSWLTDAFNGGQIKPTYLVTDAPEAKTAEIFNKLKTIGFLFEQTKDKSVIPAKYAWTGAKVFIKTFFSEIVLRDLPADSSSLQKLKTLLRNCSQSAFLDNAYPTPDNIDLIDFRTSRLEAWLTDTRNTSLSVYKLPSAGFVNRSDEIINKFTESLPTEKKRLATSLGLDRPKFLARVADLDNHFFSYFVEMTDSISDKTGDFYKGIYEYNYLYMMPGKYKKYYFPSNTTLEAGAKCARANDSLLLFAFVASGELRFQLFNSLTGCPTGAPLSVGSVESVANCELLKSDKNSFVFCNSSQNQYWNIQLSGGQLTKSDNPVLKRIVSESMAGCTAGMESFQNEIKTRIFAERGRIAVTNAVRHDGFYYRHITSFHNSAGEFMYAIARDYPNERFKLFDCQFGYTPAGLFVISHKWTDKNWDIEQFWLVDLF